MTDSIDPPRERRCEQCDRTEIWADEEGYWRVETVGDVHCIHEWDITGSYRPLSSEE